MELNVDALPTGRIRGRLLAGDGKPLWNAAVELFSVDRYKEGTRGWWEFVDDKKKYFEFDHVAPGEYLLVFNANNRLDTDVPYPRTFFRDAPDLLRAEYIRVDPGDQLLHTDIQLKAFGLPDYASNKRTAQDYAKNIPGDIQEFARNRSGDFTLNLLNTPLWQSAVQTLQAQVETFYSKLDQPPVEELTPGLQSASPPGRPEPVRLKP